MWLQRIHAREQKTGRKLMKRIMQASVEELLTADFVKEMAAAITLRKSKG
jgi:hypothetical protein